MLGRFTCFYHARTDSWIRFSARPAFRCLLTLSMTRWFSPIKGAWHPHVRNKRSPSEDLHTTTRFTGLSTLKEIRCCHLTFTVHHYLPPAFHCLFLKFKNVFVKPDQHGQC